MKTNHVSALRKLLPLILFAGFAAPLTTLAQGSAFTYQGRLTEGSSPANGSYDFRFRAAFDAFGNNYLGSPTLSNGVPVANGLFTITLDFGGSAFNGSNVWLEVDVRTNGSGGYTILSPLQLITPAPYAIMARSASNLSGTLPATQLSGAVSNSQLANNSIAINAGTGLSGGGTAALGGSVTLNNTGVISVIGNSDITASTIGGAVTLGDTATSTNIPSTIVKRDATGSFGVSNITLNGMILSGGNLLLHTYGAENFFAGLGAGNLTMFGTGNAGIGFAALGHNTSGIKNTACGHNTLFSNMTGIYNTACGEGSLYANTSGSFNSANGMTALLNNTNGSYNVAVGLSALYWNKSGSNNTANGASALYYNNGDNNTANGYEALYSNTNGRNNTAIGYGALLLNTSGWDNVANGALALFQNNADNNTADGYEALSSNTSGVNNTATGFRALYSNTNGANSTAVGFQALYNATGNNNLGLGNSAGFALTTGSNNICIGNGGVSSDTNTCRIGSSQTRTFVAGIFGATSSGGTAVFVNSSGQLGTTTSSRRFKEEIHDMDSGSDVLLSLRPVTFRYKPEIDPRGVPQFGLIAEEVDKVDPDLVVRDEQRGIYTVRYEAINAMLLNEFLKQHRKVEQQAAEINSLNEKASRIERLEKQNAVLEQELSELKAAVQRLTPRLAASPSIYSGAFSERR